MTIYLFKSSAEAAEKLGSSRVEAVTDIAKLHEPFFTSSMPTYLQDILINSLQVPYWVCVGGCGCEGGCVGGWVRGRMDVCVSAYGWLWLCGCVFLVVLVSSHKGCRAF